MALRLPDRDDQWLAQACMALRAWLLGVWGAFQVGDGIGRLASWCGLPVDPFPVFEPQ
mgnify:CR=1 FL=1